MSVIKLPELGEGVTEGVLVKWLVKEGDVVKPDQPVAEFMTDKATVEVPSPIAGRVKVLKFKEGDTVKVESVLIELEAGVAATTLAAVQEAGKKREPTTAAALGSPSEASLQSVTSPASSAGAVATSGGEQPVLLPELGEGVTEGELVKWLVAPGDQVKPDQPVAEIMTDKATVEVPSPVAGTVKSLAFKEGDTVKVGSRLLILSGVGGVAPSSSATAGVHQVSSAPVSTPKGAGTTSTPGSYLTMTSSASVTQRASPTEGIFPPVAESHVLATPSTRRLARELGVDINSIKGTGLAGRVSREDVLRAYETLSRDGVRVGRSAATSVVGGAPISGGETEERVPLRGIRKKIAENMQNAKRIVPHFTLMDEAIVTDLVAAREALKDLATQKGVKVTYLPFVIKALIATLREFPMFNASIDDEKQEIVYKKFFHIGFAADTPNGLVVPVIKHADQKNLWELSQEIVQLSTKARDGKLKPEEMKGATITITNIGSIGGTYATPIINHPEVAILGMYKISDKVVVSGEGSFRVEKAMNFTITADHRLIDGAVAARFLKAFTARIAQPAVLLMDMK